MNDDDRRSLRLTMLQMKSRTGRLTDEEARELRRTPRLVGGKEPGAGVLLVSPPMTEEEWEAEFADARLPDRPPALPQE